MKANNLARLLKISALPPVGGQIEWLASDGCGAAVIYCAVDGSVSVEVRERLDPTDSWTAVMNERFAGQLSDGVIAELDLGGGEGLLRIDYFCEAVRTMERAAA